MVRPYWSLRFVSYNFQFCTRHDKFVHLFLATVVSSIGVSRPPRSSPNCPFPQNRHGRLCTVSCDWSDCMETKLKIQFSLIPKNERAV